MSSETDRDEAGGSRGGGGSVLVVLLVAAAVGYAGKAFYTELTREDAPPATPPVAQAPTGDGQEAPPVAERPPAGREAPAADAPEDVADRLVDAGTREIRSLTDSAVREIQTLQDRAAAIDRHQRLERDVENARQRATDQLTRETRRAGGSPELVASKSAEISGVAQNETARSRDAALARPTGQPTPPAGPTEVVDAVTGSRGGDSFKFGLPPSHVSSHASEVEHQSQLWPFLVRAHAKHPRYEDADFVWDVMCTADEKKLADNEFAKVDLIRSKEAEYQNRLAQAKTRDTIRYRTTVPFGVYDFEAGALPMGTPKRGSVLLDGRYYGTIAAYRQNGTTRTNRLVDAIPMDEQTGRAVVEGSHDERVLWCDIIGTIANATEPREIEVIVQQVRVWTLDGTRYWDVDIR